MKILKHLTLSNIGLAGMVTFGIAIAGTACYISPDPYVIDRTAEAILIAQISDPSKGINKNAYEGYGESCVRESWNYPFHYMGINDWKATDPENAKPLEVTPAPHSVGCEDNFNPRNPDMPLTGQDYGFDYDLRPEAILHPTPQA